MYDDELSLVCILYIILFMDIDALIKNWIKVERVFLMVVVSMPPHAEIGRNEHRENAPHFTSVQKRYF